LRALWATAKQTIVRRCTLQTPDPIPYESALELATGPLLGVVPRSIWPDKPVLDAGYQANIRYYHSPAWVRSSSAVTPYGDLYRRGGPVVVILGMALLGWFIRVVDSRTGPNLAESPALLILPILLFPILVKQEMDFLGLSAAIVNTIVVAAVGVRLIAATERRPR
jgi:hypothetical protein